MATPLAGRWGLPEPQIPTTDGWRSLSVYSFDPDFNPPDPSSVQQQWVKEKPTEPKGSSPGWKYRRSTVLTCGRGAHVGRWFVICLFLSSPTSSVFGYGSTSISCQAKKLLQSHSFTSNPAPPPQMSGSCSNRNGNQIILLSRTRWQRCSLMITAPLGIMALHVLKQASSSVN